jgi:hypothetical protein
MLVIFPPQQAELPGSGVAASLHWDYPKGVSQMSSKSMLHNPTLSTPATGGIAHFPISVFCGWCGEDGEWEDGWEK